MSADALAVLRARTHDAITDLAGLRSSDPAARDAIHAVRLTEQTLRCWWLPALDARIAHPADE